MNLHLINQQAIQSHVAYVDMQLYLYTGFTFNFGVKTATFAGPYLVSVNLQLFNDQTLTFQNNTATTQVYKKMFINYAVQGNNRNIEVGEDYLTYTEPRTNKQVKYRIVKVINIFPEDSLGNIGYTECVGVESSLGDD